MKTLNKNLLAAATASVLALSGVASAGVVDYTSGVHHTFARDRIANNGTIIRLPSTPLIKVSPGDFNFGVVTGGDKIHAKITLTGAEFAGSYTAEEFARSFWTGTQFTAAPAAIVYVPGSATFTGGSGRAEINFEFYAPGSDSGFTGPSDAILTFPNGSGVSPYNKFTELTLADASMGAVAGNVTATVTITNLDAGIFNQLIFSSVSEIAKSKIGERIINPSFPDNGKKIDVASAPNKYTRYSPSPGTVGGSAGNPSGYNYFNAGNFQLDVEREGGAPVYQAIAPGFYSTIPATSFTFRILGDNFAPWTVATTGGIWLENSGTCSSGTRQPLTISGDNMSAAATVSGTNFLVSNLLFASATLPINVCFGSDGNTPLAENPNLSGVVEVRHPPALSAQWRQDLADLPFDLNPLLFNGEVIYFQNVNPGGNVNAESFLRLSNHNAFDCPVFIEAKDDNGMLSDEVSVTLKAHESEQFRIDALETGTDNQTPARFTSGLVPSGALTSGKWYVRVSFHCTNVTGSAWNRNKATDGVTNLTAEKNAGTQWSSDSINKKL